MKPQKHIWQDKSVNEIIDDYILSPINMKHNNEACFLSTDDFVNKDKDRMKRNTLVSGEMNLHR
jgi:hypothetical protein